MIINGQERNFEKEMTISGLLKELNLSADKVVVELNFKIIQKEKYHEIILNKEDKVEIVSFVGGG